MSDAPDRLMWRMVRFNGQDGEAAYVDLEQIGAVADAPAPPVGELAVVRGAVICLKSGHTIRVKETAEIVFDEVHRYRYVPPPAAPRMKTGTDGPNRDPAALAPITLSDAEGAGAGPALAEGAAGGHLVSRRGGGGGSGPASEIATGGNGRHDSGR